MRRLWPGPRTDALLWSLGEDPRLIEGRRFKNPAELRAEEDPAFWVAHQETAAEVDRRTRNAGSHPGQRTALLTSRRAS